MESELLIIIILLLLVVYLPLKRRRRAVAHILLRKKTRRKLNIKENEEMKEFAESFIGKDVYIKLLDGHADGYVKQVTDGGIMLEWEGNIQVVNLEYVVKIREYPHKKGKRATLWGE